jgi:catechol 2,3-dioxygenase-like lactoylglutathione lyase family enzyme
VRLSFVRLLVTDFPSAFRFYSETLGFPVTWGTAEGPYAEFEISKDTRLSINEHEVVLSVVPDGRSPSPSDRADTFVLVIEVDDVDEAANQLEGKGVELLTQPKDRSRWGVRTAHLRDPEGNLIEINCPLKQE